MSVGPTLGNYFAACVYGIVVVVLYASEPACPSLIFPFLLRHTTALRRSAETGMGVTAQKDPPQGPGCMSIVIFFPPIPNATSATAEAALRGASMCSRVFVCCLGGGGTHS